MNLERSNTFDPERFFNNPDSAPPIAKLLGWKLLAHDPDKKWIRVGFEPKREFLNPVKLGPVTTEATVTKLGRKVAFTEGLLFDSEGKLCVRATSSASLGPVPAPGA